MAFTVPALSRSDRSGRYLAFDPAQTFRGIRSSFMKSICAWCTREIGRIEGSERTDTVVSHGICPACVDNMKLQRGVSFQQFIDSIPVPVFVVDDDVVVTAANTKAGELLGKDSRAMVGFRGGNVLECAHARRPEGCGRTVHCSGCAIRRTVNRTFETGEPQNRVPATLYRADPDHPSAIALRITTIKVDGSVILRVDRMG